MGRSSVSIHYEINSCRERLRQALESVRYWEDWGRNYPWPDPSRWQWEMMESKPYNDAQYEVGKVEAELNSLEYEYRLAVEEEQRQLREQSKPKPVEPVIKPASLKSLQDIFANSNFKNKSNLTKEDFAQLINYAYSQSEQKSVAGTHPSVNSIISFGNYDWRVLEVNNTEMLILSENVLEKRRYHHSEIHVTWETCEIRNYLNRIFINGFSLQDKLRIVEKRIPASNNPFIGTRGGNATNDKIFLLGIEEVFKYLDYNGNIMRNNSPYARISNESDHLRIAKNLSGDNSSWWLRSPGGVSGLSTPDVDSSGGLFITGYSYTYENGIRPALWVKIK